MDCRFKPARSFMAWYMRLHEAEAMTMPWKTVYLRIDLPSIRAHEMVHIEQIERDGALRFFLRWLWWTWRYGYWKNPYEQEAYERWVEFLPYFEEAGDAQGRESQSCQNSNSGC